MRDQWETLVSTTTIWHIYLRDKKVVSFFFLFYCIFKLYIIVLVLPNIKMNPPEVYMCSPSWTLLPSPSPYHPSVFRRPEDWLCVCELDFFLFNFTIFYWFCHISKCICHRYTCVPHPEPSSLLPPHTIPLGLPSAPAPSIQYRASNLDWRLIPYMILYIFQCHSPKSSHPLPLPQSPKDCSIHQCLFCCLIHRVIVIIFLNSIYMR